jgi:hypothetical protein
MLRGSEPSRLFEVVDTPPLLITTEFPELLITLFEVAVFTLFPPLDVEVAEVLLVIDWVPPVTETLVPLPPPLITMLLPVLVIELLEVAVLVLPEVFTLLTYA